MRPEYNAVIVGISQYTQPKDIDNPLDPLSLIAKTCEEAISDAGNELLIKHLIESLYMVNINSWSYEDAPGELSKILDINPITKYLPDGGDTPQMLINRAAKVIATGKSRVILITGGEAQYSSYKAKKRNIKLDWPEKKKPKYMEGPLWDGINKWENDYGFKIPPYTYALFETALRAKSGRSLEDHKNYMGKLFERFAKIASNHPNSWSKEAFNSEGITTPSKVNRYINHPYTKRMCSNMFVDQSASLIMTSEEFAKKIFINKNKWVYLMGGADFRDIHEITRRPKLYNAPAMKSAAKSALHQAGLTLDDINKFDFYSCFPSVVEIMMNELGIKINDPRDLTLTGGLPFFGGPWSNYSMHAIVTAVELIRKDPKLKIMVIANGGYNTKKSVGIYGNEPPKISWNDRDDSEAQKIILEEILPEPVKQADGKITIEAYTIPYDRDGMPKYGIVVGHLENGRRTIASIMEKQEVLKELDRQELVGKTFRVKFDPEKDRNVITDVK